MTSFAAIPTPVVSDRHLMLTAAWEIAHGEALRQLAREDRDAGRIEALNTLAWYERRTRCIGAGHTHPTVHCTQDVHDPTGLVSS